MTVCVIFLIAITLSTMFTIAKLVVKVSLR